MNIPFVVSGVVDDPSFCNRQKEQADLKQHIENSQNVLIYSHRRLGKTSLILKVFNSLKNGRNITPVYVDLYGTTSIEGFIRAFVKSLSTIEPKRSRFLKLIAEKLSNFSVSFGFDPISQLPNIGVSFDRQPAAIEMEAIFQLAKTLAGKKKIVIAFDEFQEIAGYGTDTFEKDLRKIIQHHKNISYIFSGSQRHIIADMFNDSKRAFYQMAISMPLTGISTEDYIDWISDLFDQAGKEIEESAIIDIADRCDNHPKYVQEFCYTLWIAQHIGLGEINAVENEIIQKRSTEFTHIWDSLTLNQKKTLKLITAEKGAQALTAGKLSKFKFKTASQVMAAIKVLEQRELICKNGDYHIYDPLFRRWVQRLI